MGSLRTLALVGGIASVLATACSPSISTEGTSAAALSDGDECSDVDALVRAAPADRQDILQRAGQWIQNPVPYSMENYQDGYRCDCSGFVSMAWDNGESFTTGDLPPRASDSTIATEIAWEELLPGDAFNRSSVGDSGFGHVRLYAGLSSSGDVCVWEQPSTGLSTRAVLMTTQELADQGYVPIRRTGGRASYDNQYYGY